MQQLMTILPPDTNIPEAYEAGNDEQQAFVQNLALFFTGFFKVSQVVCKCGGCCADRQQAWVLGL